jgi:hypothetical protein
MLKLSLRQDLAKPQHVVKKIAGVPLQRVGIRFTDAVAVLQLDPGLEPLKKLVGLFQRPAMGFGFKVR